ncbi:MAG: ABC transporter permease [Bdellovibrionales bacterium]|nr:ABC transporter permease [Bdellovibrionales bacterium]
MLRNVTEMWRFRTLISALVGRHLNARYRGSVLGFVWSFLNPLCLIAVYALVFKYYIRFNQVDNYTLFLFAGLLPWIWFSTGILEATASISGGGSLITKAMFPAHILPTVSVLTNLANFLFAIPLLIGFMLVLGVTPTWNLIALPFVLLNEGLFLLGLSLALAALNVHFRDIQHILGNLITLWFFLCPILYPVTVIPAKMRFTLIFNPVALYTSMYHDIFINGQFPSMLEFVYTLAVACMTFMVGNMIFNYYREEFAELV